MYKIRTVLKIYNKDQALAEKLNPLLDEADKLQTLIIKELLNWTGPQYCLHKHKTNCYCENCGHDCMEEIYNYFEREVENERRNNERD